MYRVVKYGAPWCSQCKAQEREFKNNPLKYEYREVNIEELSDEDIEALKIKNLPVTIMWEEGTGALQEVQRWNGFVKAEVINNMQL